MYLLHDVRQETGNPIADGSWAANYLPIVSAMQRTCEEDR